MALPDADDLKSYLRIQTTAEDTLLAALVTAATGAVQAFVRRPLLAEARTFVIEKPARALYGTVTMLHLPIYPVAAEDSNTAAAEITDSDGTILVEGTDYRIDLRTGEIFGLSASAEFPYGNWPYTITASVGLSALDEYATAIEPVLFQAILDVAADLYQRRNPAAGSESTGGGVSTSYSGGLPPRVQDLLMPYRMVRAL